MSIYSYEKVTTVNKITPTLPFNLSYFNSYYILTNVTLNQYPFTTVIPNLGVWIPPDTFYRSGGGKKREGKDINTISDDGNIKNNKSSKNKNSRFGAGSYGLVLCVSYYQETL